MSFVFKMLSLSIYSLHFSLYWITLSCVLSSFAMRGLRSIDWLIQEADLEKISIGEQYFPNKVKNNKKMLSCKDFPSISTSGLMYLLIFIDWYWLIYWFFIVKKRALFRTSLCFDLFFVSSKKKRFPFHLRRYPLQRGRYLKMIGNYLIYLFFLISYQKIIIFFFTFLSIFLYLLLYLLF